MDEGGITKDHPANRLNLIDVSSEDDSLLYLRLNDFTGHRSKDDQKKDQCSEILEAVNDDKVDYFEKWEHQSPQLYQPLEPALRKSGKHQYNLRKSLAWDSAFFSGAGVLDPEELSSMIGGVEKVEKCSLHAIQEDLRNSDDSIPGLESDCLSVESADTDLFEDIRASIQKSAKEANATNSGDKSRSSEIDTSVLSSERKGHAARNKLEGAAASKKTSIHKLVPGRLVKQSSACSKVSQPKVLEKLASSSSALSKRVSLGINVDRAANDEINKNASGKGSMRSKVTTSANSRTSLHGRVSTRKGVHSSSAESSGTATSENNKSPSDSTKKNTVPRTSKTPSSSSTGKASSRAASRSDCQSGKTRPSDYLIAVTKHSSGASPVSSISECSSELSSCFLEHSSRTSLDTSSIVSEVSEVLETVDHADDRKLGGPETYGIRLLNESIKKASPGSAALSSVSAKPSSLRLPSPKIGFFDGVKSANLKHLPVSCSLPKGRSGNTTAGINKTTDGKVQPASTIMARRSTKPDIPQASVAVLKSSKPYPRNSNDTNKDSGATRNVKSGQGISQGIRRQLPSSLPQMNGKCQLEVEEAFAQRCDGEDEACMKDVKLGGTNI